MDPLKGPVPPLAGLWPRENGKRCHISNATELPTSLLLYDALLPQERQISFQI